MYQAINFTEKEGLYYPDSVREMKRLAQKTRWEKEILLDSYKRVDPGKSKTELYNKILEVEWMIDDVKKVVKDYEALEVKSIIYYSRNTKLCQSLENSLKRIRGRHDRIHEVYERYKKGA